MANFFAELKRRQMFRVAAAYAVVAWLLLQVVNNVAPGLTLPNWAVTLVIVLLAVGFPIALVFAWIHQLAPADGSGPGSPTARIDYVLAGSLVVVIGLVSYQQLTSSPGAGTVESRQATLAVAKSAAASPGSAISIAVLPFANLSDDRAQEFFSDGMTEEITAVLAKIPDLRVVGRTSAFQFKGQNQDLRAIGEALNATHLIEGSVRREGDRVRITAQLVKADDGLNVWSESYDRQLTGVFAIQEEIATAIAGALKMPLGLNQGEQLVANRTGDLDSYEQYLRARVLVRARSLADAITLLASVVARDPNYAPAWGLLGRAYILDPIFDPTLRSASLEEERRLLQTSSDKAGRAAAEALRLDSRNADGYSVQASLQQYSGKWAAAEDLYEQALALDSNDPEILHQYALWQAAVGRHKGALSSREKLRNLEPFVPIYNIRAAEVMELNGQRQAAIAILEATPIDAAGGLFRNTVLARAYAAEGRYGQAADTLLAVRTTLISRRSVEDAARLIRSAPARVDAQFLPLLEGSDLDFVYIHVGAIERILEQKERDVETNYTFGSSIWRPEYAAVRKTERFKALLRKAGLLDYWRARGWPDMCRPVGADDFVCD